MSIKFIFEKSLIIFFSMLLINSGAMNKDTSLYKVIPTGECIKYIEKNGLTINDESDFTIKSSSGLVYLLPTAEVVLIPTNFSENYPGIIFRDKTVFMHYADLNFFPIGEENMTWYERHNDEIKKFRTNPEFYSSILKQTPGINYPFQNIEDIKTAFLKVQSILHSQTKSISPNETEELMYSFGLGVINYLVDFKDFKPIFKEGYENYNPVTYPLLKKDNIITNVLSGCYIYLSNANVGIVNAFMHSVKLTAN